VDFEIINPVEFEGWDNRVLGLAKASFFYSSSWARVLHESYGYTPMYFVVRDGDEFRFVLPMMSIGSCLTGARGVSLPFTDYCSSYLAAESGGAELFDGIVSLGKKQGWRSIEFRGGGDFFEAHQPSQVYCLHMLDLGDESELFSKLRANTRQAVKQAQKAGVEVGVGHSPEAMDEFCRLNYMTRRKHGLPPQPDRFFEKLQTHVLQQGQGEISLARWQGKAIAASIFLRFGDQVMHKYAASDPDHLPLRANNLVMWEAIRHYATRGGDTLDLGKTATWNKGLRRFKAGWGAQEKPLKYYRYNLRRNEFEQRSEMEHGWHTSVFSKMPLPALRLAGTVLYRHMG
jgi:hypothetical protein